MAQGIYTIADDQEDFERMIYALLSFLQLPKATPLQLDIARFMNSPDWDRIIIEAFRGASKSWLASFYVVFKLSVNPNLKFLVLSASKERADNFSTFTKGLIFNCPFLQHLTPNSAQRVSNVQFDVAGVSPDHQPSVKSMGITSMIQGTRADVIIADDVESMNNSATPTLRDKLMNTIYEFESILKPGGRVKVLGTPQSENSVYHVLSREKGYKVRIWPVLVPDNNEMMQYDPDTIAPMVSELAKKKKNVHSSVEPVRFPMTEIIKKRRGMGESAFEMQFMLKTRFSDALRCPLKVSDLIVMDLDVKKGPTCVEWAARRENIDFDVPRHQSNNYVFYRPNEVSDQVAEYEGAILFIDPSGRGEDETTGIVARLLNCMVFITAIRGWPGGYEEYTLTKIAQLACDQKVNKIIVESNYGGGMYTRLLSPILREIYPVSIEEVKSLNQKELRIIDTLEPVLNRHQLIVDKTELINDLQAKGVNKRYSLVYQLSSITRERGCLLADDRIDALAGAVQYWGRYLGETVQQANKNWEEKLRDRQLEKYAEKYRRIHSIRKRSGLSLGRRRRGGYAIRMLNRM